MWSITPVGRSLAESDMKSVVSRVREMGRQVRPQSDPDGPEVTGGEVSDEGWQDQLLHVLQAMPPDAFERLSQRILRECGFTKVEVKGKSGDGGIDGIGAGMSVRPARTRGDSATQLAPAASSDRPDDGRQAYRHDRLRPYRAGDRGAAAWALYAPGSAMFDTRRLCAPRWCAPRPSHSVAALPNGN